jgi:hypothetical protein
VKEKELRDLLPQLVDLGVCPGRHGFQAGLQLSNVLLRAAQLRAQLCRCVRLSLAGQLRVVRLM